MSLEPVRELFPILESVGDEAVAALEPLAAGPRRELLAAAVDVAWPRIESSARFRDLVPAIERLDGQALDPSAAPSLIQNVLRANCATSWSALGDVTFQQVSTWPSAGEKKIKRLLTYVLESVLDSHPHQTAAGAGAANAMDAIRTLVAWAATEHGARTVGDALREAVNATGIDRVAGVFDDLARVPVQEFVGDEIARRFDPTVAARDLLSGFDDRDQTILLLRTLSMEPLTLDDVGVQFKLSRERIRQLQDRAEGSLSALVHRPEFGVLQSRAAEVRLAAGVLCPRDALPVPLLALEEIAPEDEHRAALVIAYLAGPYRFDADWLRLDEIKSIDRFLQQAVAEPLADGLASLPTALDALSAAGVSEPNLLAALAAVPKTRLVGDTVVRWDGGVGDKAEMVLRLRGRPASAEEISADIPNQHALSSLKNALGDDPRFSRVGKASWALKAWGGEEYPGLVPAMRDALTESGSRNVGELADELAEKFGVSRNSVVILSGTSPLFVTEGPLVRLRRDDEAYVPDEPLELTRGCFVVDGAWAWRTPVHYDLLRGSGLAIPEPFAVHLGLRPGQKGSLRSPIKSIALTWPSQNPSVGSLRLVAETLGAREGDFIFVRRPDPASLDFVVVPQAETEADDPARRLLAKVGAPHASGDPLVAVAIALGLGVAVQPERRDIRARLMERNEPDLVEMLDELS